MAFIYQSLVCLLYVKMLSLTFTNRELIFLPKDYAFSVSPTHKQNFKENISGFKLFPGFNFNGRPIKFQIHLCRGIIVEINA